MQVVHPKLILWMGLPLVLARELGPDHPFGPFLYVKLGAEGIAQSLGFLNSHDAAPLGPKPSARPLWS